MEPVIWEMLRSNASSIIAALALLISCLNYIHVRRVRKRDDRREADRLLDLAWPLLYGANGLAAPTATSEAEVHILSATRLEKRYARAIEYQGHVLAARQNKRVAAEKYRKAIALDTSRPSAYISLGNVLEGEHKIENYQRALKCAKIDEATSAIAHYNIALIRQQQGKLREALQHLDEALRHRPAYAEALVVRGSVLKALGERDAARDSYERAISTDPRCVWAMANLGALISDTSWDEGVGWIERAMQVDPKDDYPWAMMAAIYADRKMPHESLRYYAKAMELDPRRQTRADINYDLLVEMKALLATTSAPPDK